MYRKGGVIGEDSKHIRKERGQVSGLFGLLCIGEVLQSRQKTTEKSQNHKGS